MQCVKTCSIFSLQILLGFLLFFLLQGKQSQLQLLPRLCLLESKIDILEYFAPILNKYNSVHSSGILIKAAADRFPMNCITWAGQFIHVFYIFCTWGTTTEQVKTVQLRGTLKPPSIFKDIFQIEVDHVDLPPLEFLTKIMKF